MISVVYCTRTENKKHQEHLVKSSGLHKHIEVIEIINNGESLTKAYNRGLKQAKNAALAMKEKAKNVADKVIDTVGTYGAGVEEFGSKRVGRADADVGHPGLQ